MVRSLLWILDRFDVDQLCIKLETVLNLLAKIYGRLVRDKLAVCPLLAVSFCKLLVRYRAVTVPSAFRISNVVKLNIMGVQGEIWGARRESTGETSPSRTPLPSSPPEPQEISLISETIILASKLFFNYVITFIAILVPIGRPILKIPIIRRSLWTILVQRIEVVTLIFIFNRWRVQERIKRVRRCRSRTTRVVMILLREAVIHIAFVLRKDYKLFLRISHLSLPICLKK